MNLHTDKGEAKLVQKFAHDIVKMITEDYGSLRQSLANQIQAKSNQGILTASNDILDMYNDMRKRAMGILHHTVVLQQRLCDQLKMLIEHLEAEPQESEVAEQRQKMMGYANRIKELAHYAVEKLNMQRKRTRDAARGRIWLRDKTFWGETQLLDMLDTDAIAEKRIVNPIKRLVNQMASTSDALNKRYRDSSIERLNKMFDIAKPYIQRQIDLLVDSEEKIVYLVFEIEDDIKQSLSQLEPVKDYIRTDYYEQLEKSIELLLSDIQEDMKSYYFLEEQVRKSLDRLAA